VRECPLRQTPCRRETKTGRILLTGVLLTLLAVSSLLLAHFLRMWEHWKSALLLTLLGIVLAVLAVPALIFGVTLKAKEKDVPDAGSAT